MLLELAQWLSKDYRFFSVFNYITLRAVLDDGLAGRVLAGPPDGLRCVSDHHLEGAGTGVALGVEVAAEPRRCCRGPDICSRRGPCPLPNPSTRV